MLRSNRILLLSCVVLIFLIVILETNIYLKLRTQNNESTYLLNNYKPIPKAYMDKALDPYHMSFQPVTYDENKNRFYFNVNSYLYSWWRYYMGIDFAAWTSVANIKKDMLESATITIRYKGKISELDFNRPNGRGGTNLFFYLTGTRGTKTDAVQNKYGLEVAKFYRMVNGKKVPIKMTDMKNGDIVWREEVENLMIPPKKKGFEISQQFVIQ